ncbi:hypothetical protein DPMN_017366 [Dreissena polymorpha]|uniref:Uncharacterized protein n=1 Tax=Dreissena polymorpha TaxID=45954 RepID=A0A9D4NB87_DREPO|nr:hypothetical protein DPMN_017366 [Dreissena polymorpha]
MIHIVHVARCHDGPYNISVPCSSKYEQPDAMMGLITYLCRVDPYHPIGAKRYHVTLKLNGTWYLFASIGRIIILCN